MEGKGAFGTRSTVSSSGYTSTDSFRFRYENSSIYTNTTSSTLTSGFSVLLPENQDIFSTKSSTRILNIYAYSEICAATNNFLIKPLSSSEDTWRCTIRKKDVVVIQRKLSRSVDMWQIDDTLSTFHNSYHPNIIKLLGASISGHRIFFVYDYVSGVNLADYLRNPNLNDHSSTFSWWPWISRMQIATDIAQGLEHIHHYVKSETSIVHNNLKSTSVIITMPHFNAKICHLGIAELSGEFSGEQIGESEITGRRCYMPPESIPSGVVSQKSDVFDFGVLLLEILSGDKPLKEIYDEERGDYQKNYLINSARDAIESAEIWQWIDRRLKDQFPVEVAEKMMRVGLECVHVEPDKRPDMRCVSSKISKLYMESRVSIYLSYVKGQKTKNND